jgi:hypothetical protein
VTLINEEVLWQVAILVLSCGYSVKVLGENCKYLHGNLVPSAFSYLHACINAKILFR